MCEPQALQAALAIAPLADTSQRLSYGTAGFRTSSSDRRLRCACLRAGIAAAALSALSGSLVSGGVITASHNPPEDNGIKLVSPSGGSPDSAFEAAVEALANAPDSSDAVQHALSLFPQNFGNNNAPRPFVLVGRDTRASGPALRSLFVSGAQSVGARVLDLGQTTTPELHFAVLQRNSRLASLNSIDVAEDERQRCIHKSLYLRSMCDGFSHLFSLRGTSLAYPALIVDCANGIGAHRISDILNEQPLSQAPIVLRNDRSKSSSARENEQCGSDFVQKQHALPLCFSAQTDAGKLCASLDGDSDRIVYFLPHSDGSIALIDGDRIAALFARFVQNNFCSLPFDALHENESDCDLLSSAVIQTAYANAGSTAYLWHVLGLHVEWVPTGVKHLHSAAEQYDIGIYFEANGHGTCHFSRRLSEKLQRASERYPSAQALKALEETLNPAVGDALAVMLAVEGIRAVEGIGAAEWLELYSERASVQRKVECLQARSIRTEHAETRVVSHPELQSAIDDAVSRVRQGRAFVRPSGTEPVVRVYAEAREAAEAEWLARMVSESVKHYLKEEG